MSIELHRDCQGRLIERLAAVLPQIMVENGKFLNYESAAVLTEIDSTLPEKGKRQKIRETLSHFIGEFPFSDFVRGKIQLETYRNEPWTEAKNPTPLTEIAAYRDVAALAARLVAEFVSLPWKYTLTIALPHDIGAFFRKTLPMFALSTTVRIASPDARFTAEYEAPPAPLGLPNAFRLRSAADYLRGNHPEWEANRAYFQVQVEGFIPMFARSTPFEDGIGLIKSFFGLGIAHYLFTPEKRFGETPPREDLWIHRQVGDKWEYENSVELDHLVSSILYRFSVNEDFVGLEDNEKRQAVTQKVLDNMAAVFSTGPLAARLLLASQWHFESFGGADEILSFVQAAVVLEILLGDKAASEVLGLGELLRNRCAYLISRNQSEREQLLRDFGKIYDVRSHIVHAGQKRLNAEEWRLFVLLRSICRRVIREEARLLSGKRR